MLEGRRSENLQKDIKIGLSSVNFVFRLSAVFLQELRRTTIELLIVTMTNTVSRRDERFERDRYRVLHRYNTFFQHPTPTSWTVQCLRESRKLTWNSTSRRDGRLSEQIKSNTMARTEPQLACLQRECRDGHLT